MKSTRTGAKWAHVSCALWIPEVSIGDVEKMEPITKISCIPVSSITVLVIQHSYSAILFERTGRKIFEFIIKLFAAISVVPGVLLV